MGRKIEVYVNVSSVQQLFLGKEVKVYNSPVSYSVVKVILDWYKDKPKFAVFPDYMLLSITSTKKD